MTRKEINTQIEANSARIDELKNKNLELRRQSYLLSDNEQWFTEQLEVVTERINGKKVKRERLVGRIHWNEDFKDDDTGDVVTIERSRPVRIDGNWNW